MLLRFGRIFFLFLAFLAVCWLCGRLISLHPMGKDKLLYFDMSKVNIANIAINQRQGCLYMIARHSNFTGPFVGRPTGNNANDTLSVGMHHTIDNLVQRTIAAIRYNQVITLFRSFGRQFHTLAAIYL